ncbi:MAG: beta-lactamase family protein [Asgard group archaeon]|nr:beta-lactamase family protein [Asgard group archaeon]
MKKKVNIIKSNNELEKEITAFIEKEIDTNNILGLSFALVNDEEIIWSKGFGYTDLEKKEEVTADTLFSTQSMGKCFTATTFLILATRGIINLDDPIRKYYPDFSINTKFGNPEEEIRKLTFRRMLSHWAGFTHEAPLGNNFDDTPCSFEEHIESINKSWLKNPVGSEHSYSNIGVDLTGYAMGLTVNKSFEEVIKDELFTPLGINNATYNIKKALQSSFAHGHSGLYSTPDEQVPMLPAGGLYISAKEVALFVSFHLNKGKIGNKEFIKPELFADMYKIQYKETKEYGYGLGIYSLEHIKDSQAFEHGGGGYGYQTIMKWVPDYNIGVVVLTNDMNHSSVGKIAKKTLELYIEQNNLPHNKLIEAKLLQRLEGTYKTYRMPLFNVVFKKDRLIIYPTTYSEIELFTQDAINFVTKGGESISFELDMKGNPKSFYYDHPLFPSQVKYNDSERDEQGYKKEEWKESIGIYIQKSYGREYYVALTIINDHLYLINNDCLKLHHYKDNIYFTVDGEVVILEKNRIINRNIPTRKVELNLDMIVEKIKLAEVKHDKYRGAISSIVNILYVTESFETALGLISKVVEIDKEFKEIYSILGRRTYALGKLEESSICFETLLKIDKENEIAKKMMEKIKSR